MIDREIRKAAAGCTGEAVLTVIEVSERLGVEDLLAILFIEEFTFRIKT